MDKTLYERLAETNEKIRQYENRMKRLIQKQKEAERKARTRRLIERGAILESMIAGSETFTNEDVQFVLAAAMKSETASAALISLKKQRSEANVAELEAAQEPGV